ncbi:HDOD domain-containing protein [Halopseudomonas xinjiangensis]|uniref:HDOD domain-containing protein n=1 Tax=Halopseudomonas xinjiangensis TaxID=487184 RepID=UPI0012FD72EB|nr:HDOD domain-containing protein [Halopseudomonas xinjiangensis]
MEHSQGADIEQAFLGLLLGVHSPLPLALNQFELASIRRLESIADSALKDHALIPRVPAILPRLLTSFRDPATSSRDLAELVGRDLVSVSEVMRLANSPFYRRSSDARSLEQAVLVLGQRGLRQMVANIMLKPVYNSRRGHFSSIAAPLLWGQAEKTAAISAALAREEGDPDEFSAYLAGLSSNLGLLIGARVLDSLFDGSETPSSQLFRAQWLQASRRLTARVARAWDFPEPARDALASLQLDADVLLPACGRRLYSAERFSQYHGLLSRGRLPGSEGTSPRRLAHAEHFSIAMQTLARFDRRA